MDRTTPAPLGAGQYADRGGPAESVGSAELLKIAAEGAAADGGSGWSRRSGGRKPHGVFGLAARALRDLNAFIPD